MAAYTVIQYTEDSTLLIVRLGEFYTPPYPIKQYRYLFPLNLYPSLTPTMPITIDYTGKLVLITGGGRGIGWAITQSLARGESIPRIGPYG